MSSNTNIGNTPVNQGYVQLIHTGETGGIDGTLRTLYDGDGTASDLQIASNKVKVSTELYIGSKTATEFIQDIVGDMFTTGSYTNITTTYDDTNGNIDLSASGEVTLTGTQTLTNKTLASPTFTGTANGANLTLTGDLTVSGDTIFTNSNTVLIGDAILTLNADETGSPTANAGFEVERGTSTNKTFIWNETDDKWTIGSETFVASTVEANLTGNVTGNVTGSASLNLLKSSNLSDLASASTARSNLGVDAAGTDNSTNVTLAGSLDYITLSGQEITRNAINLGTDVTSQLPISNGGTGATNVTTARENLGLEIGLDVQAHDAGLLSIAGLTTSANKMIYTTASDTYATTTLSATARTLLDDNTTADMLTTLGLTATATELNYTDGVTSNIQTQLNGKLGTSAKAADSELLDGINSTSFVQTSRSITPVSLRGISGGGDLSADRTIELSASQLGSVALTTSDQLILFDADDYDIPKRFNAQDIFDTISGAVTVYGNTGDNRILTSGGGTTINGEANLTFDGTDLAIAATGKIYFDGGSDTYIQETADDVLKIFVGNEAKLEIDEGNENVYLNTNNLIFRTPGLAAQSKFDILNNKLGIGTTSPQSKLNINVAAESAIPSAGNDTTFLMIGNDGSGTTNYGTMIGTLNTGNGYIQQQRFDGTATTYNLLLQPNGGNVGIGTDSPSKKLSIKGTGTDLLYLEGDGITSTSIIASDTGGSTRTRSAGGKFEVYTGGSANSASASGATARFQIEEDGDIRMIVPDDKRVYFGVNNSASIRASSAGYTLFDNADGHFYIRNTVNGSNIYFGVNDGSTQYPMAITSTQRVGIGTTSPTAKLEVASGNSGGDGALDSPTIRINNTTQSADWDSGDVIGTLEWYASDTSGNAPYVTSYIKSVNEQGNGTLPSGALTFGTSAYNAVGGATEAMRIDDAGNVGIGTTSPTAKLDVRGNVSFFSSDASDFVSFTHSDNGIIINSAGSTSNKMSLNTGGTTALTIDASQNVGIGVTSPSFSYGSLGLEIQSTGDTSLRLERDGSTAFEISARSSDVLIYNPGTARNFRFGIGGTEEFRMDTSGNFHADADIIAFSTTTASDIKFKENVKSIPYGLKEVLQMNPVEFDWIEKRDGQHDIGFIAQEMEKIVPEVIKETETLEVGGTHKTMDYAKLTSILVQAIQEQQEQINELKEKLNG